MFTLQVTLATIQSTSYDQRPLIVLKSDQGNGRYCDNHAFVTVEHASKEIRESKDIIYERNRRQCDARLNYFLILSAVGLWHKSEH